jgi:glycosyltransferase involved in cell wall biosynthesis
LTGCIQAVREKDSIIISYNAIPHGIIGSLVSSISRRKHVLSLIGTDIHYWFKNRIIRSFILAICRRSYRVIVTGKVSASILESYGIDSVHIVRNTIDVTRHATGEIQKTKNNSIIFVGGLSVNKRVDRILQLVKEVNQCGVRLTCSIVGDGEEYHSLKELAAQLEISRLVEFMGYRQDSHKLMSAHSSLCLFSEYEGFPAVVAEALCSGLYVLTIGAGDIPDIATMPNPLLVYQQNWDLDFFTEKLVAILTNPTEIPAMKHVQYYRDYFSYDSGGADWRAALSRT